MPWTRTTTLAPLLLLLLATAANAEQAPVSAASEADWLSGVQDAVAAKEYEASHNGQGLQAPNRAHNLRTYFEPTGIRVVDRTAEGSPALMELRLLAIGRGELLTRIEPGAVAGDGARVEIRRSGLIEWYENSPAGLEHGVTLMERPEGEGPLVLEFSLAGARAVYADRHVVFTNPAGRRLNYGKLAVVDAAGSSVTASFEVPSTDRVRIVLADVGAIYPVIIDPLLTATADAQLESNQAGAHLGGSVSGAGDVNGDGYDDVIIGALFYDAGQTQEGAAFVFLGSASGIADGNPTTAATQLESDQAGAHLGASVSGAGDINGDGYDDVIVAAPSYDVGSSLIGAAFVFLGSASGIADGNPATAATQLDVAGS
jgi:hypothetical protein